MVLQVLRKPLQTPTLYKPRDLNLKDFAEPVPNQQVHPNTHYVNHVSERKPRQIQMHPQEEVGVGTPGVAAAIGAAEGKHPTGAMAEAEAAFHASARAAITLWLQGTPPLDAAQTQTTSRPNRTRKGTSTTWSTWTTRRTPYTQTGPPQRSTG